MSLPIFFKGVSLFESLPHNFLMGRIGAICAPHVFVVGFNNFSLTLNVQYQHLSILHNQEKRQWHADLEEGPGEPGAPLAFWRPPPVISGVWMTAPPPPPPFILRSGSATERL